MGLREKYPRLEFIGGYSVSHIKILKQKPDSCDRVLVFVEYFFGVYSESLLMLPPA